MKVVYFVTDSGRRPVEEFVNGLSIHSQRKFVLAETTQLLPGYREHSSLFDPGVVDRAHRGFHR